MGLRSKVIILALMFLLLSPGFAAWNTTWANCRNIAMTESSGQARTNDLFYIDLSAASGMPLQFGRVQNVSCEAGGGTFEPFNVVNSTHALILANHTGSSTLNYSFIYNNTTATYGLNTNITGLIVYYPMDEGTGSVLKNFAGNATNDGQYYGTPSPNWNATGKYGAAISCDGSDDYLNVTSKRPFVFMNNNNWTIEVWSRTKSTGAKHSLNRIQSGANPTGQFYQSDNFVTDPNGTYNAVTISAADKGGAFTNTIDVQKWNYKMLGFDSSQANEVQVRLTRSNGTSYYQAYDAGTSNVDDTGAGWLRGCAIAETSGANPAPSTFAATELDDLIIWTIPLPYNQLHNYTTKLSYVLGAEQASSDTEAPKVTVSSPINNSIVNPYRTLINVLAGDDSGSLANVSIYGNWSQSCYQESANISNQTGIDNGCQQTYSGNYTAYNYSAASWNSTDALWDGNWTTIAYDNLTKSGAGHSGVIINYSKPSYANLVSVVSKIGRYPNLTFESADNFTLPSNCSNQAYITIRAISYTSSGAEAQWGTAGYCWDGTDWTTLIVSPTGETTPTINKAFVSEEGISWQFSGLTNSSPFNNTNTAFNLTNYVTNGQTYSFYAEACDTSGNCNTTSNYTITIDTTNPTITSILPANNTFLQTPGSHSFNATFGGTNLNTTWLAFNNGTNFTLSALGSGIYGTTLINIPAGNLSYIFYANDSAGNNASSDNYTVAVYTPFLGICNATYSTPALYFFMAAEETGSSVNGTLEWNGSITTGAQTYSFNGSLTNNTIAFCINPASSTFDVNMTNRYYNATSAYRNYYLRNAQLTNATNNITLYLMENPYVTNVTVQVIENGVPVASNVQFLRYFIPTNTYRLVEMAETAAGGSGDIVALRADNTFYRRIVLVNGVPVATFEPIAITATSMTIDITSGGIGSYWDYYQSVYATCNYDNSTNVSTCTVTDASGTAAASAFSVQERGPLAATTSCAQSSATAATTYLCPLNATKDKTYTYTVTAQISGQNVTLASGDIVGLQSSPQYGTTGIFLSFILVAGVAAVGAFNPVAMVVLAVFGVFAANFAGLALIPAGALMALAVVAGIIMFKVRT